MTLFIISFLGGALTVLAPCILPVIPFVFARVDQPFVKSGLPMLVGMASTFAAVGTLGAAAGSWAVEANEYGRLREFQLIAVQLDEMAKELEQREREWMSSIQRQSHQVDLLRRIAQTEPLEGILRSICEFAEEQVPGAQASLLLVDEDRCVTSCIAPKLPKSYCDSLIGIRAVSGAGSCGTAIAERRVIVSEDIESDPLWVDFRTLATSHGLRACWSYPVISTGDRVFGSFALYFNEQRAPRPDELPVSRMAAEVAAVAIDRYQTGEALAQSEAEYRSLFETNPYPMWVSESASGKFLAVNDSAVMPPFSTVGRSRN